MTSHTTITLHTAAGNAASAPLTLNVDAGYTLAQAIWLSGEVVPPPLCSGLGRCGRCRVRFLSAPPAPVAAECGQAAEAGEQAAQGQLTAEELAKGWRLACRHTLHELGARVEVALPSTDIGSSKPSKPSKPGKNDSKDLANATVPHTAPKAAVPYAMAIDLGTTSLHWRVLAKDGTLLNQGQEINPQMGAGSDIMSRVAAARKPAGAAQLSELVLRRLRALVQKFPSVESLCLAANTAMTAIALQKDVSSLAAAPYALPLNGDTMVELQGLPPMYIPPQLAPFVGGDISAGMAALRQQGSPKPLDGPFLLADMGTNGEFILYITEEESYMASVPLGPALEGIGLTFGDMAGSGTTSGNALGIVNNVQLTPTGLQPATLDGAPPNRLCAVGYLSLIRALLQAGLLREEGTFCLDPALPLARKLASRLIRVGTQTRLPLWGDVYLTGEDVEEILKVKAAFSLAFAALLETALLTPADVRHIYLAGALGEHVPAQDLEDLGFVPQGMGQRIVALGNTSLLGAQALALHPALRTDIARWSHSCRLCNISERDDFTEQYMRHMRFYQF